MSSAASVPVGAPRGEAPRHTARVTAPLVDEFRAARRDPARVVLEGFHAAKHAQRFGATFERVVARRSADLAALAEGLAPELGAWLAAAERLDDDDFERLAPRAPRTGIIAVAIRPQLDAAAILASSEPAPIVVLEEPRTMGNLGAVVRVAAAAGAGGVLTTGPNDPWHPDAVRGAAGLQFALPVARLCSEVGPAAAAALAAAVREAGRPLLALDPDGTVLEHGALPARAALAFGTEREGLSDELLAHATARLALPMAPGVSSLNLATSVAATLYAWRLA
jgi:TrmH family RNA methyltransferase